MRARFSAYLRARRRWLSSLATVLAVYLYGCGTTVSVEAVQHSELGESCEALSDCAQGLACVDLVCAAASFASDASITGGPAGAALRSAVGESCTRTADCSGGLACFDRTCRASDVPIEGPRKGQNGETCAASNDCERGLGCIASTCRTRELLVPHVVNECHRVECVEPEDCCRDFRPADAALCDELEQSCEAGVLADCNLRVNLCTCSRVCDDGACVASVSCADDRDCGGSGVLRCFAGACAQCASDADCSGGAACVGGSCRAGCDRNEECPLFSACMSHRCEHVGCQSDRDCFFESGDPQSRCADHACRTQCNTDRACTLAFHTCVEGLCRFTGCEDDEECRSVLGLADQLPGTPTRALCRAPAQ